MNLDQYKSAVAALASEKRDRRFSNKGSEHAAVVVEHMFRTAKDRVCIFSGALSPEIYLQESVKQAVSEFLKREGTTLQVLTQKPISPQSEQFLKQFDRVTIRSLDREKAPEAEHHFLVADSRAYRLETDEVQREAVVNFNEPRVAVSLKAMFEREMSRTPTNKE